MLIYKCDRCKRERAWLWRYTAHVENMNLSAPIQGAATHGFDLCPECKNDLERFISLQPAGNPSLHPAGNPNEKR